MREGTGGGKLQVWLTRVGYQLIWKSFDKEDTGRYAGMYFFLLLHIFKFKKIEKLFGTFVCILSDSYCCGLGNRWSKYDEAAICQGSWFVVKSNFQLKRKKWKSVQC